MTYELKFGICPAFIGSEDRGSDIVSAIKTTHRRVISIIVGLLGGCSGLSAEYLTGNRQGEGCNFCLMYCKQPRTSCCVLRPTQPPTLNGVENLHDVSYAVKA